jgi:hypothetical protein
MAAEREALEAEEEALCRTLEAADDLLRCAPRRLRLRPCADFTRALAAAHRAKLALQEALREARRDTPGVACCLPPCADAAVLRRAQGWFDLSRARYHMGPGAVGQTQYDANMAAHVRLTAEAAGAQRRERPRCSSRAGGDSAALAGDAAPATWSLKRVEEAPGTPSELRQRARRASVDAAAADGNSTSPAANAAPRASTAGASGLPQAPLRWFAGAMPPPALRSAQQHFFRGASPAKHVRIAHA